MRSPRRDMRAVDLVEVEEVDGVDVAAPPLAAPPWRGTVGGSVPEDVPDDAQDGAPDASGRPVRRRAQDRARRRWAALAMLAVTMVVGGGAAVSDSREAARLAAVAELPGALEVIQAPLTEVWRADTRLWPPLDEVAGVLVGVDDVWDGSRDIALVGIDAATGRELWRTPVVGSAASPNGGMRCVVPDAPAGATDSDRLVVCLSIDDLGPASYDLSRLEPSRSRVLVLAAATGELLEERDVDPTTSIAALGPDLVVKDLTDDGRVRVRRTSPRGGDVRWTFTAPPTSGPARYSFVRTDAELVVVPGEEGWLLTPDGEVFHHWEQDRPPAATWALVLGDRALVQPLRGVVGSMRVIDLRSGESATTDGYPLIPAVDDGSAGDVILVQSAQDEGLAARDIASWRVRWTVEGEDDGGSVVLDGRVVRAADDRLEALDAETGETLWQTPAVRSRQYGLHTDGRVVVRSERDVDLGTVLVARRLDDGRVSWTTDVTDELERLVEVEGRLYGLTDDATIALR